MKFEKQLEFKLAPEIERLYQKCLNKNPRITRLAYMELRKEALLKSSVNSFWVEQGFLEEIKLAPKLEELYQKCIKKNSKVTRMDFLKLRENALKASNPGVRDFWINNGIVTEEKPEIDS